MSQKTASAPGAAKPAAAVRDAARQLAQRIASELGCPPPHS